MRNSLLLLVAVTAACAAPSTQEQRSPADPEVIVLVHGFGPTLRLMAPLSDALTAEGYRTVLWDYPSTTRPVAECASLLCKQLAELDADPTVRRIHLVTHSMGGVVSRAALAADPPAKLGRVVMLAPPNRGCPRADFFAPWLGGLLGPLHDLETAPESAANVLPPIRSVEIGVIAGEHDGTVPARFTALEGATDWLLLRGGIFETSHNGLLLGNDEARRQVLFFLDRGRFDRAPLSANDP